MYWCRFLSMTRSRILLSAMLKEEWNPAKRKGFCSYGFNKPSQNTKSSASREPVKQLKPWKLVPDDICELTRRPVRQTGITRMSHRETTESILGGNACMSFSAMQQYNQMTMPKPGVAGMAAPGCCRQSDNSLSSGAVRPGIARLTQLERHRVICRSQPCLNRASMEGLTTKNEYSCHRNRTHVDHGETTLDDDDKILHATKVNKENLGCRGTDHGQLEWAILKKHWHYHLQ